MKSPKLLVAAGAGATATGTGTGMATVAAKPVAVADVGEQAGRAVKVSLLTMKAG